MMNHFFTLLLAASCLTAVGQVPGYVFDSQLEDQGWELLLERQGQQYWLLNQDYTWEVGHLHKSWRLPVLAKLSAEHFDVWSQVEHGVDSVQYWTGIHQDFELVDCNSGGDGLALTEHLSSTGWYPGEPSNQGGEGNFNGPSGHSME